VPEGTVRSESSLLHHDGPEPVGIKRVGLIDDPWVEPAPDTSTEPALPRGRCTQRPSEGSLY
jgi:hypothetical protein